MGKEKVTHIGYNKVNSYKYTHNNYKSFYQSHIGNSLLQDIFFVLYLCLLQKKN